MAPAPLSPPLLWSHPLPLQSLPPQPSVLYVGRAQPSPRPSTDALFLPPLALSQPTCRRRSTVVSCFGAVLRRALQQH